MRQPITSLPALTCFRAAAKFENFSQAADSLNLTHGAISRAVRLLEDDLGVALFERKNRRVVLTAAGRKLSFAVDQGLSVIEQTIGDIKQHAHRSPLLVSCEPTLLMRWLIPQIEEFKTLHADIDIELLAGGGDIILGQTVQLAIRRNDFEWPEGYYAYPLFDEMIGPVCQPSKLSEFFDKSDEVKSQTTLLHTKTRPSAWQTWWEINQQTMPPNPSMEFEHFYFSLQAASAGLGVAIGPYHLVKQELKAGLLTAPHGFQADGSSYVLLSQNAIGEGSVEAAFRDWLKAIV